MVIDAIEQLPWVGWVKERMAMEESSSGDSSHDGSGSSGSSSGSPSFSSGSPSGSPSGHHDEHEHEHDEHEHEKDEHEHEEDEHEHEHDEHESPSKHHYEAGPSGSPSGPSEDDDDASQSPSGRKYGAEHIEGGGMGGPAPDHGLPADPSKNARGKKYEANGSLLGNLVNTSGNSLEGKPVNTSGATVADPKLMKLARKSDRKDRYRRLEKKVDFLLEENKKLKQERSAALRFSRLTDLRSKGFVFEIAEELEDTASFTDEQFERHCKRIPTRYTKVPVGEPRFYVPENIPGDDAKPDKVQAEKGKRVKEKHEMYRKAEEAAVRRGEKPQHKTFAEIQDEVEQEFSGRSKAV
jgi:hypothetical protein